MKRGIDNIIGGNVEKMAKVQGKCFLVVSCKLIGDQ